MYQNLCFVINLSFTKFLSFPNSTGEVKTKGILDRETVKSFTLHVQASDHGKPLPKSGYATVIISVADVNDNRPIFTKVCFIYSFCITIINIIGLIKSIFDTTAATLSIYKQCFKYPLSFYSALTQSLFLI